MIYFDNAATTAQKPREVKTAVINALEHYTANPGRSGYKYSVKTADAVYEVRKKTAEFFGADGAENVVFTSNCTQSINTVLKGILKKGDHLVVSSLEHNAVMRPLNKLGIRFSVAEVDFEDDNKTCENFKNAIKPNTKMIFCTGASNVCGKILPIKKIGEICKLKRIIFGVDAAQTAGVIPINMKESNIDFLCVAAHKGLYALTGLGVLICRKNIPETLIEGGTGTNSLSLLQPLEMPERLESGTLNVPAVISLGAGLDFINKKGITKIYKHESEITNKIYKSLSKNTDIVLYTPPPYFWQFVPVLSFNLKGVTSSDTAALLDKHNICVRAGYHCAPTAHKVMNTLESGTVRVSFSAFNTLFEAEEFLKVMNDKNFYKKLKKVVD